MLSWDNGTPADKTTYTYDGLSNRISQAIGTTSPTVTKYLLDTQPTLTYVLAATTGSATERYVHGPMGIHAQQDSAGAWDWMVQDALGSVRGVVDNTLAVQESRMYDPYGKAFGVVGTNQTVYGFTGEQTDDNDQVYLRARHYNPNIGVFTALDPFEGVVSRPMSLNGYSWVEGNTPNAVDPSGMSLILANALNSSMCMQTSQLISIIQDDDPCGCYCDINPTNYDDWQCTVCRAFRDGLAIGVGFEFSFCETTCKLEIASNPIIAYNIEWGHHTFLIFTR